MSRGANLVFVQAYNQRIILDTIRRYGPLSRADIARRTNLTKQAVSNIVSDLIDRQLVISTGTQRSKQPGKPSIGLELNAGGTFTIGLNLDRDRLTGILMNLAGEIMTRTGMPVGSPSADEVIPLMHGIVHDFVENHKVPRERLLGVGIGLPGPLHTGSQSDYSSFGLPGWGGSSAHQRLQHSLKLPIFIENNAAAAALGEWWYGVGKQFDHFLYVFFGLGLGGGVLIGGQPHRGDHGFAGEIGQIPVGIGDELLSSGEIKRLSDYFTLSTLYRRLAETGQVVTRPADLEALYRAGHTRLIEWLDEAAEQLARVLITAEFLMDPEAILFGGRLPKAPVDHLIEQLERLLVPLRGAYKPHAPQLLQARAGDDAAALGVATLPIHETFAPSHHVLAKKRAGMLEDTLTSSQEGGTGSPG